MTRVGRHGWWLVAAVGVWLAVASNAVPSAGAEPDRTTRGSASSRPPELPAPTVQSIERCIRDGMERWGVPGLAIGIVQGDHLVYAGGFGVRDTARSLPVTPTTTFGLASMTKAFTSLAVGLMVQDGRIGWDEAMADRIPDLALADPDLAARVTFRDILSHRTGLADKDDLWTSGEYLSAEIFHHLDELEVAAPLGTHFEYSNVLYIAAAVMVEKLGGETWDALLRRRVLAPLGMVHTGFSVEELLAEPEYSVSFSVEDGSPVANEFPGPEHRSWYFTRGSGSVYSDLEDLARWSSLQLHEGVYRGVRIVDPATVAETHRVACPLPEPPFYLAYPGIEDHGYAMGWFSDLYRGHRRLHHGGTSLGYSNYIALFPDDDLAIIVLSNRAVLFPVELTYRVSDILFGLEPADWAGRFQDYVPAH